MSKGLIENQQELEFHKNWSLFIFNFLKENYSSNRNNYYDEIVKIVLMTYELKDLRGMRILSKESIRFAKQYSKEQIKILNQELFEQFGMDIYTYNNNAKRIKEIIKRGEIKNLPEYELLLDYLEDIFEDAANQEEIDKINPLLEAYQRKTGKV